MPLQHRKLLGEEGHLMGQSVKAEPNISQSEAATIS